MQDFNSEEQNDPHQPPGSFFRTLNPFAYVFVVLAIVFILYQFIGASLAVIAGGMDVENLNVQTTRIILSFGQFMFILAPTIFFTRFQTPHLKQFFRLNAPKPSLMLLAIMGIILIQPFLQGYMYLQDQALNSLPFVKDAAKPLKEIFDTFEKSTMKIVQAHSFIEFLVVVFVICLTPAICEEALFRGFTLTNLRRVSKPAIAIFMSGFLFAFYHFQPFNLIPLILLGWYLGFIVYYSNSIWVGIICHFLNNFFASYFLYQYGKNEFETPHLAGDELTNTIVAAVVSLILFSSTLFLFYRLRAKEKEAFVENGGSTGRI